MHLLPDLMAKKCPSAMLVLHEYPLTANAWLHLQT